MQYIDIKHITPRDGDVRMNASLTRESNIQGGEMAICRTIMNVSDMPILSLTDEFIEIAGVKTDLSGDYTSIRVFLTHLNTKFVDTFHIDENYDTLLMTITVKASVTIGCSSTIISLLNKFIGVVYDKDKNTITFPRIDSYTQYASTFDLFYNWKVLSLRSNLPIVSEISIDNSQVANSEAFLFDHILSSPSDFRQGMNEVVYIPSVYRIVSMMPSSIFNTFSIEPVILYGNNKIIPIRSKRGRYFNVKLFIKT